MEKKLNLILKALSLILQLKYGFSVPQVEALVKEIEAEVKKPITQIPIQEPIKESGGRKSFFGIKKTKGE